MKILRILFLFISCYHFQAKALVYLDVNAGIFGGGIDMEERVTSTQSLGHSGKVFGMGLGGRAGLSVSMFKFGAFTELAWLQLDGKRENPNSTSIFGDGAHGYDNTMRRTSLGLFAILDLAIFPIGVVTEYIPLVNGKVNYSEGKSQNPISKGSKLDGSAFGLGLTTKLSFLRGSLIYRLYKYDKQTMVSGAKQTYPNATFSKYETWEIFLQGAINFDLF